MVKFGSHNMSLLYQNQCYNQVCYKGTALFVLNCLISRILHMGRPVTLYSYAVGIQMQFTNTSKNEPTPYYVKNNTHMIGLFCCDSCRKY